MEYKRSSKVPPGGWNAATFRGRAAVRLIRDFVNLNRASRAHTQRRMDPVVRDGLKAMTGAVAAAFRRTMAVPVTRAMVEKANLKPEDLTGLGAMERDAVILFETVLNNVLTELTIGGQLQQVLKVDVEVINDVASEVSDLLGRQADIAQALDLNARAARVASMVTRISETTRVRMRDFFARQLIDNATVKESIDRFAEDFPDIEAWRVNTIVRTESGNIVDEGTKAALRGSGVVAFVSVIGCEAREKNSPRYNGESTCNASMVPVADINQLRFHPNHTGCIVPAAFRDGTPV